MTPSSNLLCRNRFKRYGSEESGRKQPDNPCELPHIGFSGKFLSGGNRSSPMSRFGEIFDDVNFKICSCRFSRRRLSQRERAKPKHAQILTVQANLGDVMKSTEVKRFGGNHFPFGQIYFKGFQIRRPAGVILDSILKPRGPVHQFREFHRRGSAPLGVELDGPSPLHLHQLRITGEIEASWGR